MTTGRVLACLKNYQKAERYSSMACEGFIRQFIEKHGPEGAYSHDVSDRVVESETRRFTAEDEQLLRHLSISFYTNASHREKLGQFQNGLESALEAKRYQEKLAEGSQKDRSFMKTIQLKIDSLRSKLNNERTFAANQNLIKHRAEENMSKLRESHSRPGSANVYSTLPVNQSKASHIPSKRATAKNLAQIPQNPNSKLHKPKAQTKKHRIIKRQPGSYKEIVKEPTTKKNFDSVRFRVTSLYLHNEYFHGNYSNGIQMYQSTCNNEKFFPYKTLNPIPNDANYVKKVRPDSVSAGNPYNKNINRLATGSKNYNVDNMDDDLASENEKVLVESFDSNPGEVIELYSPANESSAPIIPDRPKSAAARQKEYQLEHGKHPGTIALQDDNTSRDLAGEKLPNNDQEDRLKKHPRSKSRSGTHHSHKKDPMPVEDPNNLDDEF